MGNNGIRSKIANAVAVAQSNGKLDLSTSKKVNLVEYFPWADAAVMKSIENVTAVDLTSSSLTRVPREIVQLQKLRSLSCADNQIVEFPSHVRHSSRIYSVSCVPPRAACGLCREN
jgi:Leucine-rich repeat (LRR) protein